MTLCEEIARWASRLSAGELGSSVAARARLQHASARAAASAGADAAASFARVAPAPPVGDVYRNAAASIAHDWDEYLFMGHPGHSTVWAARAFCADEERALVAQVAGNEIAGRLGAALFLGPHNGQFWSSIHCGGAAIAAGLGLGLDARRLAHALAIALYQPPYGLWPGFMGPQTKLLTAAEPAAQGARAALLAADGVTGGLDVIESPRGLLTHFAFAPQPSMLGGLGRIWLTDTLAFKPFPGCAYLQSAVDAGLRAEVDAGEVANVDVEAGYLTCEMERLGAGKSLTAVRVNFSTALSVAAALIAGRLTHEELRPGWLAEHETRLRELAARVRVRHDWALTAETLRGTVEAGAGLGGASRADWRRTARRTRELNMSVAPGRGDVRKLLGDPEARGAIAAVLWRALRTPSSIESIDVRGMRLTFPSRLRIRMRSGRLIEVAGREQGGCGAGLAEQREVVARKCRVAGVEEPAAEPLSRRRAGARS